MNYLQQSAMYLLVFMLCWNAFSTMLMSVGIQVNGIQPGIQGTGTIDLNGTLTGYQVNPLMGWADFGWGTLHFFGQVGSFLIYGGPQLVIQAGVPAFIVTPIIAVWLFIWFAVITLYWIGGREV